jgi:nucleoside phosphorylase
MLGLDTSIYYEQSGTSQKDGTMSVPIALTRLMGHMQRWQRLHYKPYHLFLSQKSIEQASRAGYLALAQLLKAGYFSVIVTTNSNGLLEHSLKSVGVELTVLSIGEDADEEIFHALEDPIGKVCMIKLSQDYEDNTTAVAPLSSALGIALQRYLSCDLIIVGPVTPNSRLAEMIQPDASSGTYYCVNEQPSSDDSIVQLLHIKYLSEDDFLISGEYGHFNLFFQTLLRPNEIRSEIGIDVPPSPRQRRDAHHANNKKSGAEAHKTISHKKADILLVTVTEIEAQAILNCSPSPMKHFIDQVVYYDFGSIGSARTVMARSTHIGPFAAIHCVNEGIEHFSPRTVIIVGVAFGFQPHEQKIGDILIAKQIMNGDFQKIRTGSDNQPVILPRGAGIPVTDRLLNSFQAAQLDWTTPPHIHFGQIVSSSRLIDHEGTRDELLHSFPEAIGGEMEGHGFCDACSRKKVDWILVKAICDWADGNKDQNKDGYQRLAAGNAARFVLSVIQQYGLL